MEPSVTTRVNTAGTVLRHLREQAGISQVELAKRAGMSKVALCRIERGYRSLPPEAERRLLAALRELREEKLRGLVAVHVPDTLSEEARPC